MSTDTPSVDIEIENVGPIINLKFVIKPGVTVLRGRNETGKSTAIDAVSALGGSKAHLNELNSRDTTPVGAVSGGGVNLVISRHSRNTISGELEVESVDDRIDLAALVSPPIKEAAARGRARVKALLQLIGAEISDAEWMKHDTRELLLEQDLDAKEPIITYGKVKRRIEAEARKLTEKANAKKAEAKALKVSADETADLQDTDAIGVEDAKSIHHQAVIDLSELQGASKLAKSQAEEHESKKAEYDEAVEKGRQLNGMIAEATGMQELAIRGINDRADSLRDAFNEQNDLEKRAKDVEDKITQLNSEMEIFTDQSTVAQNLRESLEEQQKAFNLLKDFAETPVAAGPTDEEMQAAEKDVDAALGTITQSTEVERIDKLLACHAEAMQESKSLSNAAKTLRGDAKALDSVLAGAIDSPYFTFLDGEMHYTGHDDEDPDREPEPFDRLSDGKRWTVAIAAVAYALNLTKTEEFDMAVVGISQTAWEALDSVNRSAVVFAAIEAKLGILTAEHDDGALRYEEASVMPEDD